MRTIRIAVKQDEHGLLQTAVYVDPDEAGTQDEDDLIGSLQKQLLAQIDRMISKTQILQSAAVIEIATEDQVAKIHRKFGGGRKDGKT